MSDLLNEIKEAIIDGSAKIVSEKVTAALEEGFDPEQILNDAMIAGMAEVGQLFEDGEYFVPEMLVAARAMTTGMQILKPRLVQADVKAAGKVAIGTVQGDLHDIGKNLVGMMLEGASFEIIDLGADVPPEKFVEAVQKDHVQIVAMSALLTTTMPSMNGASRSIRADAPRAARRLEPASTVMATAPAAIHAGGSASVGSSSRNVHRRKTIVMMIR